MTDMIKIDIKMPECCHECFAHNNEANECNISNASLDYFNTYVCRAPNCPLEEIEDEEHKKPCEWCQEWDCEGCKYAK